MTDPTYLTCNSSSEAPPKEALTLHIESRTAELIRECLEDGTQLDMMRDLWYEMKDDRIIVSGYPDKSEHHEKYKDKIARIIYDTFANEAEKDPSIYTRLGLHSRVLTKGEVPIVVIFEKAKKVALPIVNEFHAGYAFSEGQFPTFESVHVANYFNECGYNKGYVFVVSDYDPAGEHMCNSIREKMDKFSNIDIETIWVNYGEEPVSEFDSYELMDNKTNKKWIEEGRDRGVEFNTPTNIRNGILHYLTNSIVSNVDPRYYVLHSYIKWTYMEQGELANNDTTFQKWSKESSRLHTLMDQRRNEYREAVSRIETDYHGHTNLHTGRARGHSNIVATTKARGKETMMDFEDIEYFKSLLGSNSPYADDLEQDELTDEELQMIMAEYAEGEIK